MQEYDSMKCGYFCIGFIDFMLAGKTLTEFTNLFSANNFKKNDDTILINMTINISKRLNATVMKLIMYIRT